MYTLNIKTILKGDMEFSLEIIGFTLQGCLLAQDSGAQRVELCDNPNDGGTTASFGFIKAAREKLHIDVYPIIRPRAGDFLYTDEEFEIMKTDIRQCRELGCNGVVTGCLTKDGKVDKKRSGLLVEYAYPLGVTFHRAFDRTADPFQSLEDIIDIGCERILTSGQRATAPEGANLIKQLIARANERVIIMPGSGVRSLNVAQLAETTGAVEFHSSAKTALPSKMAYVNKLLKENTDGITVDGDEVKKIVSILSLLQPGLQL